MTDQKQMNTVDSMLPIPQLFAFGLQHVLAMYAGAVAVPIIVAQAMNLPVDPGQSGCCRDNNQSSLYHLCQNYECSRLLF